MSERPCLILFYFGFSRSTAAGLEQKQQLKGSPSSSSSFFFSPLVSLLSAPTFLFSSFSPSTLPGDGLHRPTIFTPVCVCMCSLRVHTRAHTHRKERGGKREATTLRVMRVCTWIGEEEEEEEEKETQWGRRK